MKVGQSWAAMAQAVRNFGQTGADPERDQQRLRAARDAIGGPYFQRMLDSGAVDCLQADVTRCGGISGFLRVAALCDARSMDLSAHCRGSRSAGPTWSSGGSGDPRGGSTMMAAGALFLLGCGLTAAGVLWSGLYDIGILVVIVAAIGIVVRAGDWVRVWRDRRAAGDRHALLSLLTGNEGERP